MDIYYTMSKPELEFDWSNCKFSFFDGVLTIDASHDLTADDRRFHENCNPVWLYQEVGEDEKPTQRWLQLRENTRVIIMRGNITNIPYLFAHFVNLHTIVFPEALREIGYLNFVECPKLKFLHLPKNVKKVDGLTDINCMTYIDVAEDNDDFCSVGGYLMSKDQKTLVAAPGGLRVVEIPEGCEVIAQEALFNKHEKIVIPSSVKRIHALNFYSNNLKEIVLGDYERQYPLIESCFTRHDSLEEESKRKLKSINVH